MVEDWTNRNTVTGEIIFDMKRTRSGRYADPELLMHKKAMRNAKKI